MLIFSTGFAFSQSKRIVYCSNQTSTEFIQVFIMNEDGSAKNQLTDLQENCMKPKFSADGKQIVFYTDRGDVYLIRDIEKSKNFLNPFYVGPGTNPVFMPDGSQILYNSEIEDVLSIFAIDTASYAAVPQIVSDGGYSNMQILSSDGSKLLYSSFYEGAKAIMIADMNDTSENYLKKISMNDDANLEPDISRDGKKYTYASFDNNLKGTIRINENGKETLLTKGMASANVPRFSPDGNKIAFVVITDRQVTLYVMNTDGSSKADLNISGDVGTFEWIDNDRIVYDAGSETKTNVGIVEISSGSNNIIATGGFNLHPSSSK